jgi:DeoR/GlpR family transcriptional regulator of sugar metabolism
VAGIDEIDKFVTDENFSKEAMKDLNEHGVEALVASGVNN